MSRGGWSIRSGAQVGRLALGVVTMVAELVLTGVSAVLAAVRAYGSRVWERVADEAADAGADATVRVGRRLLRLVRRRDVSSVAGVVDRIAGGDSEAEAELPVVVERVLSADEELRRDWTVVVGSLSGAQVHVDRSQGVQIGDHNSQHNTFGAGPA